MTTALANWNGEEMPLADVRVPALDRAFLFGDAVYEVIRLYRGRPWKLEEHLGRLRASTEAVRISGVDEAVLRRRLLETIEHSRVCEGLAYLQVTRGAARRSHGFPAHCRPNVLIYAEEYADPYADKRELGVEAITYPDIRWARNEIKATSLLANCLAAQAAVEAGAAESILVDTGGFVTEGSHTSVFAVKEGSVVISPASTKVLPGITKRQVITLARQSGIAITEGRLKKDDLWAVDEVFLTGTPEEILPVTAIDGKAVGSGAPGPVTRRLQQTFKETLEQWLEETVPR